MPTATWKVPTLKLKFGNVLKLNEEHKMDVLPANLVMLDEEKDVIANAIPASFRTGSYVKFEEVLYLLDVPTVRSGLSLSLSLSLFLSLRSFSLFLSHSISLSLSLSLLIVMY